MKKLYLLSTLVLFFIGQVFAQHNNELFSDGALIHIESGAEVYVRGDMHMVGSSTTLENDGLIQVEGNLYSNTNFQQRGTGTVRIYNENVNTGAAQFISGSYAVRGGQAQIGVDDGSFYNLELANDQGIVYLIGTGNIADVRNSVDFAPAAASASVNRIITHDISSLPANGSGYSAVFGLMNPNPGNGNMSSNSVDLGGNVSPIDAGFIQGKFRRAVDPAGGIYGYPMGLEPAGPGAARGVQYVHLDLDANNYDVIEGYFEQGSANIVAGSPVECLYAIDYFGGADHGEWNFNDITGTGTGTYEISVWPQDANFTPQTIWIVTKDDAIQGTPGDCGPSPIGLSRSGLDGFSEFGLSGGSSFPLPVELIYIKADPIDNEYIQVSWATAVEINNSGFELLRSTDGRTFTPITWVDGIGNTTEQQDYAFDDHNVIPGQIYYYKIKQVDFDGTESFTPIVSASLIPANNSVLVSDLMPNPANDYTQLVVSSDVGMDAEIYLINELGQFITSEAIVINDGSNNYTINTSNLAVGTYHVILQTSKERHVKRLMVVE